MFQPVCTDPRARVERRVSFLNKHLAAATALTLGAFASNAHASNFTTGNVVVVRVGTGAAALSNAATAVFLDEYSPAGVLQQTIALPTVASGANRPFTNSGSATSEGFLNLSADGQYLIQAGYGALPGTLAVVGTTSAATPRVVARIDLSGIVDTSTALSDAYSANNIRSATSDDGTRFWTGGTATTGGGVRFATFGGTTTTQLSTTLTNTRVVGIANGQLYVSSASGAFQGVSTVGTGLPTTSGQTITLLPGFPASAGSYDYYFADASTVYVADDRSTASGGGIQKWTFNGTAWTLTYTLNSGLTTGLRGLSGVAGSSPLRLYATSTDTATKLVTVVDGGAPSAFTTIATAGANTAFRGVRHLPVTCNAPTIGTQPHDASVCPGGSTSFTVSATGTAPLSYTWQLNGTPVVNAGSISGQGTATLSVSPVTAGDAGSYTCVVTNACSSATSEAAMLVVLTADADGDGAADCNDGCPTDPQKTAPGACGCGVADVDSDGDGTLDCFDGCPADPLKVAPGACGCGVLDTDSDADGTPDCNDGCPTDPAKTTPGACGCGVADVDTDSDGTLDCVDGCPSDPLKTAPGACGCGVLDTDSDADGTADCNDSCPTDPAKTTPGACGCGVADVDTDGDFVADCIDNCDALTNPTQVDADSDGVGDACDNCPALANTTQADCDADGTGDVCAIAAGAADCNANGIPDACDLSSGTSLDTNVNGLPDECETGVLAFCFGDGTGTACPCGNESSLGASLGCRNSLGLGGGLTASGTPSLSSDTLTLTGFNLPNSFALYFQGTTQESGGAGVVFGDGKRCAGGSVTRLVTVLNVVGGSSVPSAMNPTPVSVQGNVFASGIRTYQVWYRNSAPFCTSSTFNLTNGVQVVWAP